MTAPMPNEKRRFDRAVSIIDAVSKIVFLIGGGFALWQYWAAVEEQKVERTVAYFQRYEDGSVADARHRTNSNLRKYLVQLREFQSVGIAKEDRDRFVISLVENDEVLPDDIDRIVDFFEGLSACVDEKLCEESVAEKYFFKSDTDILWKNFYPYFEYRRINSPTYAAGLMRFSQASQNDQETNSKRNGSQNSH